MTMTNATQNPNFSGSKFHRLYGKCLSVALEATFPLDADLRFLVPELYTAELVYNPSHEVVRRAYSQSQLDYLRRRVYHPALEEGDMTKQDNVKVKFIPWVDDTDAQFYRILFRLKPLDGGGKTFRWMQLGRFGEEKPFGFDPQNPKKCYIYLDLLSKTSEFKPVYTKVQRDTGDFTYFVIEVAVAEDGVTLSAREVEPREAPEHLAKAMPA